MCRLWSHHRPALAGAADPKIEKAMMAVAMMTRRIFKVVAPSASGSDRSHFVTPSVRSCSNW